MDYQTNGQKTVIPEFHETAEHGTPGFPMRVYFNDFTTYVAGQIPWHWHEELEFCVILKGQVDFSLPGQELRLQKGEGMFINANTLHHMVPAAGEMAYMFSVVVHPGLLSADKGFVLSSRYVRPYISDGQQPFYKIGSDSPEEQHILQLLQQMYDAEKEKAFALEYKLHNLICEVWLNLLSVAWNKEPAGESGKDADKERLHMALQFIQDHFQEEISLNDICKAASVSRSECCRCFKRNLQMSPMAYLIMYRVNAAAAQLEEGNKSITEIALDTGFTDDSYFCKIFKRYMQMTPLAYRKQKLTAKNS